MEISSAAPDAPDRAACRDLLDHLPDRVTDQSRRAVEPADGWGAAWGDPAIVLTCGSREPAGFTRTSTCTTVNGVDWFIPEEQLDSDEPVALTMTTVNRRQFVRVELPVDYWPPATALADLSSAVTEHVARTGRCR